MGTVSKTATTVWYAPPIQNINGLISKAPKNMSDFFKDADLLIFDAQYNLTEVLDKPDWGHSTPMMGAELAYRAQVKRLALISSRPNQ